MPTGFIYFASWDYFTSTYAPSLPHVGTCAGEPFAAATGCVILSSYLVLFISFYLATYKSASTKSKKAAASKAVHGMEEKEVPGMKGTAEKATRVAQKVNGGAHNITPTGPFF